VLKDLKSEAKRRGITVVRAVEEAMESFLAVRLAGLTPPAPPEELVEEPVVATTRALQPEVTGKTGCHCYQCGHRWTPRGQGKPPYCPACQSREWEAPKCTNGGCERDRAAKDSEAASAQLCEPCYREMVASQEG
jgi:hypothetical protein